MGRSLFAVVLGYALLSISSRLLFMVWRNPGPSVTFVYGTAFAFGTGYVVALVARRMEVAHAVALAALLVPTDIIAILFASGQPLIYVIALAAAQIVAILAGAGIRARQARSARA